MASAVFYFAFIFVNINLPALPEKAPSEGRCINIMPEQSVNLSGDSVATSKIRVASVKVKGISNNDYSLKTISPASRFSWLDEYARNAPLRWEKSIEMLADSLTKPARNDMEKARLLFTWVATHIKYDIRTYKDNKYLENNASTTLRKKMGLCGDFSSLLTDLCQASGMEAYRISGLTKGYRYRKYKNAMPAHHAWNVIHIDNRWTLSDVTWASGVFQSNGDSINYVPRFEPFWFDVKPEAFIFTHFPDSGRWQLLGRDMISYERFLTLPFLSSEFFKAQFDSYSVFQSAVRHNETGFVKVFNQQHPVKVTKAPLTKYLTRNNKVSFIVVSDFAESVALKEDGKWYFFLKELNTFSLDYEPRGKSVIITVLDKDGNTYKRLLEYETKL
jgi:transglutaminase/protease-like cytokinesis protein 3